MTPNWNPEKIAQTAQSVMEARKSGTPRDTFPGEVPSNLSDAYAVQGAAIKSWPDKLVGFKVGGIPEKFREKFPSDGLAGPVFEKNVFHFTDGEILDFPVFENGFAAYEPELVFQINTSNFAEEQVWTVDNARQTIERVFLGAEIAASPNINVNKLGPGSIISDFGNNAGIIVGREMPVSQLDDLLNVMVETRIDGTFIGKCSPNPVPDGPLGALAFLLEHLHANKDLYVLPDKLYVSSGAISGVHESEVGTTAEMIYEDLQTLKVQLVGDSSKFVTT